MVYVRVVVIGGGAAGASAASRARRESPHSEVYLIEETHLITHAPCGIPYAIGGLSPFNRLFAYTPEKFQRDRGINVILNATVFDIDIDSKTIHYTRKGGAERLRYDKLIIATGARPLIPKVNGAELDGVETIRHPAYVDRLIDKINKSKEIVVAGGGYIGIEVVENLLRLNKKVILIEKAPLLMERSLDKEIAGLLTEEVRKKGVDLRLEESVLEIERRNGRLTVITDKGDYAGDLVILALGVRPNSELANKAGIPLGVGGAVKVNEYMETEVSDVLAAGDVAEKVHKVTKTKTWVPLAPTANKEGFVAGNNAVSARKIPFPGVVGTSITRFDELYVGKTGITEKEALELGIKVRSKLIKHHTKAHYYPGGREVYIKLIAREDNDVIVGAQIAGYTEAVSGYIDTMSIAVDRGLTLWELFFADLGYMPAVAPVWHPLITASRVLLKD